MKTKALPGLLLLLACHLGYGQTSAQIANATAFARLYGYVRFFHPSDEAAGIDWDRFAIYGARQVEGCRNARELQATLTALFQPIAPTLRIHPAHQAATFNQQDLSPPDSAAYQVVAWQHQGVRLGGESDLYKSGRTNRSGYQKFTDNLFGPLHASLDAAAYRNKEFIFRARVKMGRDSGTGRLWVRVIRADQKPGFFDKMEDRPIRSEKWQEYEIKGRIDVDARQIIIGALLNNTGELWLDDLKLLVKEGNAWKEVYANSFEDEKPGQAPKDLKSGPLVYQYRVMPLDGAGPAKWVSIKRETPVREIPPALLFEKHARVGEYAHKDIGAGLKAIVPLALYGTKTQTYPAADKMRLSQLQKALAAIPAEDITGSNLYLRLADIAITWNIFQHFYPYFDVAQTNWPKDLETAVKHAYADRSDADFLRTLQQLTAKLKDGHVRVSVPTVRALHAPITWEWIENQLVVTQVLDPAIPLAKGDVVTRINGASAEDYFGQAHQYISAATKGYLDYRAKMETLLGEEGSLLILKVKKADKTQTEVPLKRDRTIQQVARSLPKQDTIRQLSEGIMYLNLSTASMGTINKVMPQLQRSKAIICDLRGYPAGNHQLINHLLSRKDNSAQWMQIPQIIYPDQENIAGYSKSKWNMEPAKPHLNAKVIFLIDGRAISYAESFMGFIEHYQLATIVGQPTAGTNGNVNPFTLPGGFSLQWTGMKVLKHDGSRHHGVGILPHVYVEKTIKGVRENRDEFLEKALEIADSAN